MSCCVDQPISHPGIKHNESASELVRCELCGSTQSEKLFSGGDRLHGIDGLFSVVQCSQCGLIYLSQPPTHVSAFYPEMSYAPHGGSESKRHFSMGWRRVGLRRRCQAVVAAKQTGTILDIGCGNGDFLHTLAGQGQWRLMGIDTSKAAAKRARKQYGITVLTGPLSELQLPAGGFDVVTMWHVLEHLPSPRQVLVEVHRLLNEEGVLIISCPMADSPERWVFGRYWAGYDVPRHLFSFSRSTLRALLEGTGFRASELPGVVIGFNSLRISVGFWLKSLFPSLPNTSKWLSRGTSLLALALLPAMQLLGLLPGWGNSVGTFMATKHAKHAS
jgi:SAM-dependent methyltransferase